MKITPERLRQIITEEVIKEELAPEIAGPAIAAMLQGMEAEVTSDVFGDVFTHMYGEEALQAQADAAQPGEPEEDFPTEYQPGGGEGDRPVMGFKENLNEIIQEEYYTFLIQEAWQYTPFGMDPESGQPRTREAWARAVLENPEDYDRVDVYEAETLAKQGFPPHSSEFSGAETPMSPAVVKNTPDDIAKVALSWEKFINNTSRGNIPKAIATLKAKSKLSGQYQGKSIVPILKSLYDRLRSFEQHDVGQVAEKKDNPWAICTDSVGREDKEKYEKCVKSVKKEKGIE